MAKNLNGVFTALVTPMNKDGSLDWGALDALVDLQMTAGISGLVPCGTTGEAPTLSPEEHAQIIERVVKKVNGRAPVIAGTGGNDTKKVIEAQKRAKGAGATHGLIVTPYYNKPTPEGLYRHYKAVVEAVDLPVVLYNVPGRTGCDLKPETTCRLAQLPHIVGIKEAVPEADRVTAIRLGTNKNFAILSGEDSATFDFMLRGGNGVISVVSNVAPREFVELVEHASAGRVNEARARHEQLRDLMSVLFCESNPIPVKAALAMQGHVQESYRLPLCEMGAENRMKLEKVLRAGAFLK